VSFKLILQKQHQLQLIIFFVTKKQFLISKTEGLNEIVTKTTPNAMQIEALGNLENLRKQSFNNIRNRNGKTYLSAFDAKAFNTKNYYL
jgi:hypothetical protein